MSAVISSTCLCNSPSSWDQYVLASSGGTPFHLHGWCSVIEKSYRHPTYFLNAHTQSRGKKNIVGILPLALFSGPGDESRLVSLPFLDCAGILADNPFIEQLLFKEALIISERIGAVHLELRMDRSLSFLNEQGFEIPKQYRHQVHSFKVGLRRSLPGSKEELWQALDSKVRNQVRKARKCECRSRVGGVELLSLFYAVFSQNMRDLGSPVHALSFFEEMFLKFKDQATIILIEREQEPIAGAVIVRMHETMYNPWASSLRAFRPLCPNMLLYWQMLALACEQGARFFDFGRSSPGAPTHRFKKQWGAESRPLAWHIFSRKPNIWSPERESLVIEAWKQLDLELSRKRGPELRRWISL
ncbi:MAG: GNAT family N-acetyltransferase [Proteobacteria bacterium]|nr:GNAT family N-acetyltransferase [Pseudomonadota bacterium]MBU1060896.1 GNAT family N-acetyltransferase [Pseudomonadota bacterium]